MSAIPTKPTKRQIEALRLLSEGRSIDEVAHDMKVSRSTVEKTLRAVRERLGGRTIPQAVYIAAKNGIFVLAVMATVGGADDDMIRARRGGRSRRRDDSAITTEIS